MNISGPAASPSSPFGPGRPGGPAGPVAESSIKQRLLKLISYSWPVYKNLAMLCSVHCTL